METRVDIPYVQEAPGLTGTLGKDSWKAQWAEDIEIKKVPSPPSLIEIPLAVLSLFCCPILGPLAVIFAVESRIVYKKGHFLESEALSERARGTSCYAIAIGLGLIIVMGLLLGLGQRFNWY